MRRPIWIALIVLLALAAGAWLWTSRDAGQDARPLSPAASRPPDGIAPPSTLAADPAHRAVGASTGAQDEKPVDPSGRAPASIVSVRGRVTTDSKAPAPGADVDVVVNRASSPIEQVHTTADEKGGYAAELPLLSALDETARATCIIFVTATLPRRQAGREHANLETWKGGEIPIDVELGASIPQSIAGRVLHADGKPAAGVGVEPCSEGQKVVAGYAITDPRGRFVLSIASPGRYVVVAADAKEGVARSEALELRAGEEKDVGDLRLHRGAVIEGRVELPDGSAAPKVTVEARLVADPKSAGCADASLQMMAPQATTSSDGSFAFRHLRAARYRVQTLGSRATEDTESSRAVDTDAIGVRLVVRARFLVVHVVDAAGKPVLGSECSYEEVRDDGEDGAMGGGNFSDETGAQVFSFREPCRVRVSLSAGALEAELIDVVLPRDRWRVDATAVLRPKTSHGTIRLEIVDGEGNAIPEWKAEATALIDGVPTTIVGHSAWDSEKGPASKPLRPGRYLVEVVPGMSRFVPKDPGSPAFGRHREEVTVPAGEGITLRVVAQPGGWLRAKVTTPDEKPGVRCGYSIQREGHESDAALWGAWSDPVEKGHWHGLQTGGPQFFSHSFGPGRYVLTVRAESFRDSRSAFEIRAGETTDVQVKLEPK